MEKAIIILHGWQSQTKKWNKLKTVLQKQYQVFLPDLPGFGKNQIHKPYFLKDYANWLKKYINSHNLKSPIIIGHSFGGRIAISYAAKYKNINKLILINSAGIKPKLSFKKASGFVLAKVGKFLFKMPVLTFLQNKAKTLLYRVLREKDYYQAKPILKQTMVNVIKKDLKTILPKIRTPTLILWGANDKITPLRDGNLIMKKIRNSKLIVFKNASHSLPFTHAAPVGREILDFI
jgi:pimeloyl-ACP methyl ester carboxylesterase